jgi:hypothetical protein
MSLIRLGVPPNVHRWELHLAGMKISIHALLMLKSVEIATIQFCVLNKSPTPFLSECGRLPVDPAESGGAGSDGRLHCEDGAE